VCEAKQTNLNQQQQQQEQQTDINLSVKKYPKHNQINKYKKKERNNTPIFVYSV